MSGPRNNNNDDDDLGWSGNGLPGNKNANDGNPSYLNGPGNYSGKSDNSKSSFGTFRRSPVYSLSDEFDIEAEKGGACDEDDDDGDGRLPLPPSDLLDEFDDDERDSILDDDSYFRLRAGSGRQRLSSGHAAEALHYDGDNDDDDVDDDVDPIMDSLMGEETLRALLDADVRLASAPLRPPASIRLLAGNAAQWRGRRDNQSGSKEAEHSIKSEMKRSVSDDYDDVTDDDSEEVSSFLRGPLMAAKSSARAQYKETGTARLFASQDGSVNRRNKNGRRREEFPTPSAVRNQFIRSPQHFLPHEQKSHTRAGTIQSLDLGYKFEKIHGHMDSIHESPGKLYEASDNLTNAEEPNRHFGGANGSGRANGSATSHLEEEFDNNRLSIGNDALRNDALAPREMTTKNTHHDEIYNTGISGNSPSDPWERDPTQSYEQFVNRSNEPEEKRDKYPTDKERGPDIQIRNGQKRGKSMDTLIKLGEQQMRMSSSSNGASAASEAKPKKSFLRKGTRKEPSALNKIENGKKTNISSKGESDAELKARIERFEQMQKDQLENLERRKTRIEEVSKQRWYAKMKEAKARDVSTDSLEKTLSSNANTNSGNSASSQTRQRPLSRNSWENNNAIDVNSEKLISESKLNSSDYPTPSQVRPTSVAKPDNINSNRHLPLNDHNEWEGSENITPSQARQQSMNRDTRGTNAFKKRLPQDQSEELAPSQQRSQSTITDKSSKSSFANQSPWNDPDHSIPPRSRPQSVRSEENFIMGQSSQTGRAGWDEQQFPTPSQARPLSVRNDRLSTTVKTEWDDPMNPALSQFHQHSVRNHDIIGEKSAMNQIQQNDHYGWDNPENPTPSQVRQYSVRNERSERDGVLNQMSLDTQKGWDHPQYPTPSQARPNSGGKSSLINQTSQNDEKAWDDPNNPTPSQVRQYSVRNNDTFSRNDLGKGWDDPNNPTPSQVRPKSTKRVSIINQNSMDSCQTSSLNDETNYNQYNETKREVSDDDDESSSVDADKTPPCNGQIESNEDDGEVRKRRAAGGKLPSNNKAPPNRVGASGALKSKKDTKEQQRSSVASNKPRSKSTPRPGSTKNITNERVRIKRSASCKTDDDLEAEMKRKEEEQWSLIKNMRKRQEAALREAEGERERAKAWAASERESVRKWAEEQRSLIRKDRHKAANAALIATKKAAKENDERTASKSKNVDEVMQAELQHLRSEVKKMKAEAEKSRKLKERVRMQELTINELMNTKEAAESSKPLKKRTVGSRPALSDCTKVKQNTRQGQKPPGAKGNSTRRNSVDNGLERPHTNNKPKNFLKSGGRISKAKNQAAPSTANEASDNCDASSEEAIDSLTEEPTEHWLQRHLAALKKPNGEQRENSDDLCLRELSNGINNLYLNSRSENDHGLNEEISTDSNTEGTYYSNQFMPGQRKPYNAANYSAKSSNQQNVSALTGQSSLRSESSQLMDPHNSMLSGSEGTSKDHEGPARQIFTYKNGARKEILSDGTTTVSYANGDKKRTYTNEKKGIVVYYYAATKTTQITHQNGMETFHFPNKQVENHHTDGRKEIIFPDGTQRMVFPNGTCDTTFPDGVRVIDHPDGTQQVSKPN